MNKFGNIKWYGRKVFVDNFIGFPSHLQRNRTKPQRTLSGNIADNRPSVERNVNILSRIPTEMHLKLSI